MVKNKRIPQLSRFPVPASTSSELRTLRAERRDLARRLREAERQAIRAEQRYDALAEMEEKGGTLVWQNTWHQDDTSAVLKFRTNYQVGHLQIHRIRTLPL